MKKVILLVRVSSVGQDYEGQSKELVAFAQNDGYTKSEMAIIEEKESATTLRYEERQGLKRMFETIDNPDNDIKAVYCWDLTRLGRTQVIIWQAIGDLNERGVNLIVKKDNLDFQRDKGNSIMMFGLFAAVSEQETAKKNERTALGRKTNAEKGCFNGGFPLYGYTYNKEVTKHKEYKIKDDEANNVRTLFELYATGKYGLNKLRAELIKLGIDLPMQKIIMILKRREYTGETIPNTTYIRNANGKKKQYNKYSRTLPSIISVELFEKCRAVALTNNTNVDKSKNIYYANHLITCKECGHKLTASKKSVLYRCFYANNFTQEKKCKSKDSININVMDAILWACSKDAEADFILNYSEKSVKEWENSIVKLQSEIDSSEQQYELIKEAKRKELQNFMGSALDNKELESLVLKATATKTEKQRIDNDLIRNKEEISRLQKLIEAEQYPIMGKGRKAKSIKAKNAQFKKASAYDKSKKANILEDLAVADDKTRYDIVHKHIKTVRVENESTKTKRITIYYHDMYGLGDGDRYDVFYYDFRAHDKTKQIYQVVPEEVPDFGGMIDYADFEVVERFTCNKQSSKKTIAAN